MASPYTFFPGLPDDTEFSSSSPCFSGDNFSDLISTYGIGNGCSQRVAAKEFNIILKTKADCLLKNVDEDKSVAELDWAIVELVTALEMREELLAV